MLQNETFLLKKEFMVACDMKLPPDENIVSIEFNASEKAILKKLKEVFL